jgi:hypothetical protein
VNRGRNAQQAIFPKYERLMRSVEKNTIVECHSEWEYPQEPRAWMQAGRRQLVQRVLTEARFPEGKRFLVQTEEGELYMLVYHIEAGQWRVFPAPPLSAGSHARRE